MNQAPEKRKVGLIRAIILFLIMYVLSLYLCDFNHTESAQQTDSSELKAAAGKRDSFESIPVNASFPFGAVGLSRYRFPKFWEIDPYEEASTPDEEDFDSLTSILHRIHAQPTIVKPKLDRVEWIELNEEYLADTTYFDWAAVRNWDSCVYRLPDVKTFSCYYFRQHSLKNNYGAYGSLLFVNPTTSGGKMMTIYFEYGREQNLNLRYYYFDKDTLHLFDGSCYDDGSRLSKSFRIYVNADGELQVDKMSANKR